MESFKLFFTLCDDNSCCCLSPKSTSVLISGIGLLSCLLEEHSTDSIGPNSDEAREYLITLRNLLVTLYQMANVLLLLGSIGGSALLLQIYLWYMLAYVVISFVVAIVEFCFCVKENGVRGFTTFVPEVLFLFVMFRCLSLVDIYRRHLRGT